MKLAINRQNLKEAQWGRYRGVYFYPSQLPRARTVDVIPCTARGEVEQSIIPVRTSQVTAKGPKRRLRCIDGPSDTDASLLPVLARDALRVDGN
jgi:hypothetical protein